MISSYNKTTESIDRDIIELLSTFSPIQWLYVLLVLVTFSILLHYGRKHVYGDQRPESIWIVSMFFLGQDYLDEVTLFLKILSIGMSFFSFFVMQYMQNSANTNLVTKKDPIAVKSFQDLLQRPDVNVYWVAIQEMDHFKHAAIGSLEEKVWAAKSFADGRNLMSRESSADFAMKLRSTKAVFIMNQFQESQLPAICKHLREELNDMDINTLLVLGDGFKEFPIAGFVSKHTHPEIYKKSLVRSVQLLLDFIYECLLN